MFCFYSLRFTDLHWYYASVKLSGLFYLHVTYYYREMHDSIHKLEALQNFPTRFHMQSLLSHNPSLWLAWGNDEKKKTYWRHVFLHRLQQRLVISLFINGGSLSIMTSYNSVYTLETRWFLPVYFSPVQLPVKDFSRYDQNVFLTVST